MISNLRPDMAEVILTPEKELERTADDRTLGKTWIKIFIVCGVLTIAAAVLLTVGILRGSYLMKEGIIMLIFVLAFDTYVITKFVGSKYVSPAAFKKAVAKYGRENVLAQLRDSSALGFFIDEDNYVSLTILTLDYLIGANEFLFALKDIKAIVVSKSDVPEERLQVYKDEHIRNVLRCVYMIEVTQASGISKRQYVSLTTPDLNAFFGYIQQRAPHIRITYK